MSWKAIVYAFGLLVASACQGVTVSEVDPETDSRPPLQGPVMEAPAMQPTAALDAGRPEPDAMVAPAAAGSGGSQAPVMRSPPAPVQPQPQQPAPPAPLPLTLSFSPAGGGFAQAFELSVQPADPVAQVHYTLDGSIPSNSSPVATGPIPIAKTTLVRAVAVRAGELGPITNQVYFALAADVRDFRSDLPVIVIDMQSGPLPDPVSAEHVSAVLGVFEPMAGMTQLAGSASVTSRAGIKVRGRSTRDQPKHSYTLELRGVDQEDSSVSLLGMPAEGDWVLYAPYNNDRSLMHNVVGYTLSRRIGRYAPRTSYCELFLVSGTTGVTQATYAGIYVLTERISRGAQRVPVQKLHPEDLAEPALSGGYIVQANEPDMPDEGFDAFGERFLFVHPKQEDVQPAQTQYIAGYLETAMRAASAADGIDPMTGKHYSDLIDVAAFVDHHILNVLIKNPDAFALSSFFYKDRVGRLNAGPLWDLDLAMGAEDPWGQRSIDPTQWSPAGESFFERSFWTPLFSHAEFERAYWERWRELLAEPFAATQVEKLVDELEQQVTLAEPRNRKRWPASAPRDDSFAAEADALRAWLAARVAWISANVGTLPAR